MTEASIQSLVSFDDVLSWIITAKRGIHLFCNDVLKCKSQDGHEVIKSIFKCAVIHLLCKDVSSTDQHHDLVCPQPMDKRAFYSGVAGLVNQHISSELLMAPFDETKTFFHWHLQNSVDELEQKGAVNASLIGLGNIIWVFTRTQTDLYAPHASDLQNLFNNNPKYA